MPTRAAKADIEELARVIAGQAQAIADDTLQAPLHSAALRLAHNADMLKSWTEEI